MASSTLLLFAQPTGHVLAAVTQVAASSAPQKPDPFAGDFLPVRYLGDTTATGYSTAQVFVPLDQLGIFAADASKVPIAGARGWMITQDSAKNNTLSPLPQNQVSVSDTQGNKGINSITSTGGGTIVLSGTPPSTQPVTCWVRIQPASTDPTQFGAAAQTFSASAQLASGKFSANITVPKVQGGNYWALILVTGSTPRLETFTVT